MNILKPITVPQLSVGAQPTASGITPASGNTVYTDSTLNTLWYKDSTGVARPVSGHTPGAIVSTFTSTTTNSGVVGFTMPANTLAVGSCLRVKIMGTVTATGQPASVGSGSTQSNFLLYLGGSTFSMSAPNANGTNLIFRLEANATVYTTGTNGTALAMMWLENPNGYAGFANPVATYPNSGTAATTGAINTTVANSTLFSCYTSNSSATLTINLATMELNR